MRSIGKKKFKDRLLNDWCLQNGYRMLRISDDFYTNNKRAILDYITGFLNSGDEYLELY